MLSSWPMLRVMVASNASWSFLMNSIRKRLRKVPIRKVPNRSPGRSPEFRRQYIHIIRPNNAK